MCSAALSSSAVNVGPFDCSFSATSLLNISPQSLLRSQGTCRLGDCTPSSHKTSPPYSGP